MPPTICSVRPFCLVGKRETWSEREGQEELYPETCTQVDSRNCLLKACQSTMHHFDELDSLSNTAFVDHAFVFSEPSNLRLVMVLHSLSKTSSSEYHVLQ